MSWQPLDAILILLFASLYAGMYALVGLIGSWSYRRLFVGWLASLAGCILGYGLGHLANLHFLWLGSFPWPEATLGAILLLVVASRLRV